MFPYDFRLLQKYTLEGRSLKIIYEVENTDTKKFPFFTETIQDLIVRWLREKNIQTQKSCLNKRTCTVPTPVPETGLLDMKHDPYILRRFEYSELNHEMFEIDAVILDGTEIKKIKTCFQESGKGIRDGI